MYGKDYENTKHNLGFMFLDYVADKNKFNIDKKELDSITGNFNYNNEKVLFIKPTTYMNLSGNAVKKMKDYYKIENKDILIVYDDIDIEFGNIRFKDDSSGGTHNGMKNIIQVLNTTTIPRIRIGLGGIKNENQDLSSFVLQRFKKEEMLKLKEVFDKVYEKMIEFLDN
jgi:peptidyl-tRNA hydrolase, PTH1 family